MFQLSLPSPYDFKLSFERFRLVGDDLANLWQGDGLHRFMNGQEVRIEAALGGVQVAPSDSVIEQETRTLVGERHDLRGFAATVSGSDPILGNLIVTLRGYRPPLSPDPWETLVTVVTSQGIPVSSATTVRNRMTEQWGAKGRHAYAFPTRARVRELDEEDLVGVGLAEDKAQCVLRIARLDQDLSRLADASEVEVKSTLTSIEGVNDWVADWFLARHLGRAQAWPASDVGLRKAVGFFYHRGKEMTADEVRAFGIRFSPYQNLAAHYLMVGLRRRGAGRARA